MEEFTLGVQIETTSTCNAGCSFCVYPQVAKGRAGKLMSIELFRKIVDEVATIPQVGDIKLMGLNEPLLDRRLEEMVAYIKKVAPRINTVIYTNGLLLTPARYDSLRAAGMDTIMISLNAVRPEQHDQIMKMRGKFETICANADYAIANTKTGMVTELRAVFTGDTFTRKDALEFYERWGHAHKGGHGLVARHANWAGDMDVPHEAQGLAFSNLWCFRATSQIYIMYDGRISTCCMDPLGRQVFGDLNKQTIREAYNSEPYVKFREAHSKNEADRYEICKNCTRI